MATRTEMDRWLGISSALLGDLMPAGTGPEIFGNDLPPAEFRRLVDEESAAVDEALVAMATAADEHAVRAIARSLDRRTVIAWFSRWAHYHDRWESLLQNPQAMEMHWIPPRDTWRAVLLAMTQENDRSTAACTALWGDAFGEPSGTLG